MKSRGEGLHGFITVGRVSLQHAHVSKLSNVFYGSLCCAVVELQNPLIKKIQLNSFLGMQSKRMALEIVTLKDGFLSEADDHNIFQVLIFEKHGGLRPQAFCYCRSLLQIELKPQLLRNASWHCSAGILFIFFIACNSVSSCSSSFPSFAKRRKKVMFANAFLLNLTT